MEARKYLIAAVVIFAVACSSNNDSPVGEGNLLVYDTREILQCLPIVITPEESAQLLINIGIDVISSLCGNLTGVAFPDVCGASSGKIIAHEIRMENLAGAEGAGFQDIETLVNTDNDIGYEVYECSGT